jgi:hypothetical protein
MLNYYLCDADYVSSRLIKGRTLFAHPMIIPLFTLVSDPVVLMSVPPLYYAVPPPVL